MVNPTGYTALDMIGFTDQGTYSSSDNYVKNDLVHYSGNIWRCLVDDTTAITPVEGVNWTLFIGEPTNLVERIIAPVETDPSTNSYVVGRQFIYNDKLYEVITAITAGDALVTYEDDPTNANIKLADPVETQLLNVKGNLSNRNLLDNAWFTVNQRGQSSYTNSSGAIYTVDRWILSNTNNDSSLTVNSDGSITLIGGTSIAFLENRFENKVFPFEFYKGKTMTISVLYGDGTLKSATIIVPNDEDTDWALATELLYDSTIGGARFYYRHAYGSPLFAQIEAFSGKSVTVKAMKVELGSISTLAMDTAPNYATELLKCQRYFYRYKANDSSGYMGMGGIQSTNNLRFILNLPTTMRQSPTITYSGSFNIADFGASNISTNITNITKQAFHGNSIVIIVQSSDTLVTATPAILKANSDANAYIDFSADL